MNRINVRWISIAALAVSVVTLVLVGTMFWHDWQRDHPETNELTVSLLMRSDNGEVGDGCSVDVVRKESGLVSWQSSQLIVENADGTIVGVAPISNGVIEDRGHANYCVGTVTLNVDESDFYLFSVFEWNHRALSSDSLEGADWVVEIYLDE